MSRKHLLPLYDDSWAYGLLLDDDAQWQDFMLSLHHTEHQAAITVTKSHQHRRTKLSRDLYTQNSLCSVVIREHDLALAHDYSKEEHNDGTMDVCGSMVVAGRRTPREINAWTKLQTIAHRLYILVMLGKHACFQAICHKLCDLRPGDADLQACVQMMQVTQICWVKGGPIKRNEEDFDEIEQAISNIMVSCNKGAKTDDGWGCSSAITASSNPSHFMLELLVLQCGAAWWCEQWDLLEVSLRGLFQLLSTIGNSEEFAWHAGMAHTYKARILQYMVKSCTDRNRANNMHRERISQLEQAVCYFRRDTSADSARMYFLSHMRLADICLTDGKLNRAELHLTELDDYIMGLSSDWQSRNKRDNDENIARATADWQDKVWHDWDIGEYALLKARLHHQQHDDVGGALAILLQFQPRAGYISVRMQREIAYYQDCAVQGLEAAFGSVLEFQEQTENVDSDTSNVLDWAVTHKQWNREPPEETDTTDA